MFLQKNEADGYEQLQIFIEPKGSQLLEKDEWKEKFLLQIKDSAVPVKVFKENAQKRPGTNTRENVSAL